MRAWTKVACGLAALIAALCLAAPAAASKPGDTEHGVNRKKLAATALRIVEQRNGIDVQRVSKCGPRKGKGKLQFSVWICMWRAEGIYRQGQIPYACAGRAVYKRKKRKWFVDRCENSRQPMVPLLDNPNPPPVFGYNDDFIFRSGAQLDLLASSGAEIARTGLPWGGVEQTPGHWNWGGSDILYQQLMDRGIKPLWVITSVPCYAQEKPQQCAHGDNGMHPTPAYYDDLANFAVMVAKRYPGSAGIEVFNEPNYPLFWGGPPDPKAYSAMLKVVADTVHTRAPGMPVISAGLSPHSDTDTSGSMGYRDFLIAMYENGAPQHVDAIGIHPYPGVGPNEDPIGDVRVYLGKIQNVMVRYNDAARPLWVTEFGVSIAGDHAFNPQQAADTVVALLRMFQHVPGIQLALVHRFIDTIGGREGGFAVLNHDLTPRPAFCAISAQVGVPTPAVCGG